MPTLITPADAGYDDARRVWNARFDRRPAAIARCVDVAEVQGALEFARQRSWPVAVRSGGHDYAGHSVCDDGLVIDLSGMNVVDVDAVRQIARVRPGARWADVDAATQAFGLATTGGTVSTVGVAGYILGGGTGHLVRKYGLGLDNLVGAEVVTANGEVLRADEREHADLFWALRGGSGNFGIVTAFELRLHPLGTQVLAGQILHRLADAPAVLRAWRNFMADAPDEVQCYAFFFRIPPVPAFPESLHNEVALDLVVTYAGDLVAGERVLAPLRALGTPVLDTTAPAPYVALQGAFDAGMVAGNRWYSRAHYLRELNDAAIETIVSRSATLPGEFTLVYLEPFGGAVARVPPDATAFPHREAPMAIHIFPGWIDRAEDTRIMEWTQTFHEALRPQATGGTYVNLLAGDEQDRPRAAYGANYERLSELKRRYDPDNRFRSNHNISPAIE